MFLPRFALVMTEEEFKARTKRAAIQTTKLVESLPRSKPADHFGGQLLRSSSSVACNCRSACRARSDAEMAAKLGIAEEEADESRFWLEMLVDTGCVRQAVIQHLHKEFGELMAMLIASRKTLRGRIQKSGSIIRESRQGYNKTPARGSR